MKQAVVALALMGIEKLFGCKHKRFSFPQTRRIKKEAVTYVVCLKCGTEFEYDFEQMKIKEGTYIFNSLGGESQ